MKLSHAETSLEASFLRFFLLWDRQRLRVLGVKNTKCKATLEYGVGDEHSLALGVESLKCAEHPMLWGDGERRKSTSTPTSATHCISPRIRPRTPSHS